MRNKNEASKIVESAALWFWTDDPRPISHAAGVLLVTQAMWDAATVEIKAKFRPVDATNGLIGYGLVIEDILFVLLD